MLATDMLAVAFSWYFSHLLRFNFDIPQAQFQTLIRILALIIGIKILTFLLFDLYQGMWRYTSLMDLFNIIKAGSLASAIVILMTLLIHGFSGVSRAVFIIDWGMTFLFISGTRLAIRMFFWLGAGDESTSLNWKRFIPLYDRKSRTVKRLLIVGAGDFG